MKKKIELFFLGFCCGVILSGAIVAMGQIVNAIERDNNKGEWTVEVIPAEVNFPTEFYTPSELEGYLQNREDVNILAQLIWVEARGVDSITEKAAVVWCVLNRVDAQGYACGGNIQEVITFDGQFSNCLEAPITQDNTQIAADVLARWHAEKAGEENVGRVLPEEYIYFEGDGIKNHFTNEWMGEKTWDWSLPSPYES